MSSKIFQNVINQMKEALPVPCGVVDERGYIIASSDLAMIGSQLEGFDASALENETGPVAIGGMVFRSLTEDNGGFEYACYVEGVGAEARSLCIIASVAFLEAKQNYDEKHNKAAFIKNIISDNILPGDVYVRAKELHFITDEPRCVILVRQIGSNDIIAIETIQRMFTDRQNTFVLNINESDAVIVRQLKDEDDLSEAVTAAERIERQLKEELGITTKIGISTVAHHLRELADRYKEAQVAIDVGSIFDSEKTIIKYDSLGLGRIIYQLPTTLCEMFLNEIFKKNSIESLDDDTLDTINRFFENNLNVSETSRKLYVHRNTLVYRLEKIKKLTGLDLREFDHAIVFKVAMMVKMYLDSLSSGNRY